jgi:hypothetical protein
MGKLNIACIFFWWGKLKEIYKLKDLSIGGRIILRWMLKK